MSRTKQRENRRMKNTYDKRPWLNSEGYHDPTAYTALKRIEKEEHTDIASRRCLRSQMSAV